MEVVVGKHADKKQGVGHISADARELPECEVTALTLPNYTTFQVLCSSWGPAGIGRSSTQGVIT